MHGRDVGDSAPENKILLLRCADRILAKRIEIEGQTVRCTAYDLATRFDAITMPVHGLFGVWRLLKDDLLPEPTICAVRGGLIGRDKATGILRRLHARDGEPATIFDVPRSWLALDLDHVPLPSNVDWRDLKACGAIAARQLPAEFQNRLAIVQATAGHGLKPGARLRLWYWLSRPLTGAEAKLWLKDAAIDHCLLVPSQPIYTAAPVFIGRPDILPARLAWLDGQAPVPVPPADGLAAKQAAKQARRAAYAASPLPLTNARLVKIARNVLHAREGERNSMLFRAACDIGRGSARGEMDREDGRTLLLTLADRVGLPEAEAARTIESGFKTTEFDTEQSHERGIDH